MPFVKVLKNKAYFRRFQVKYRRRREGKTDYRQRHKLITQDKNKYNSHKYRLVVRFTNKYVLCQVIYSEIDGDKVFCEASSRELARYGLPVGLKNYSAAYATGLLVARRLLKKVGLDEIYSGVEEVDGTPISTKHGKKTYYVSEVDDERRPFRALLDVGIKNTTTGAKIFGAMKGASDGGLDIPHSEKRFPGYTRDTKDFDAEVHKSRIMGEHVADYMRELEEDDEEMYQKHFARYIENNIDADGLEELLEKVHEAIRENPERVEKEKFTAIDKSFKKTPKLSLAERKANSNAKKAALKAQLGGDDEEEGDEEED
jgi:large subunit ribosomal protein L5e